MEQGIRDQPTDGMGHGFIKGAFFAAGAVASWLILFLLIDVPGSTSAFDPILEGPGIAILVIGYLAGLAAATRRSTRRLGIRHRHRCDRRRSSVVHVYLDGVVCELGLVNSRCRVVRPHDRRNGPQCPAVRRPHGSVPRWVSTVARCQLQFARQPDRLGAHERDVGPATTQGRRAPPRRGARRAGRRGRRWVRSW